MKVIFKLMVLMLFVCSCTKKQDPINKAPDVSQVKTGSEKYSLTMNSLIGKWALLLPEGGSSTTEYIQISESGGVYRLTGVYQKSKFDGQLEEKDGALFFLDPVLGKHKVTRVRSAYKEQDASISLSLVNEVEDIWLGSFQNVDILKGLGN